MTATRSSADSLAGTERTGLSTDERNHKMTRDSVALVLSYGLTAVVGLAFWAVAARTVPASRLGIDTAIISAFTSAATIAATGLANAVLALLPLAGPARGALLRTGYLVAVGTSLVSGLVAGLLVAHLLPDQRHESLVVLGVMSAAVLWALFVVQDPVLTATGRARWLLLENVPVNLVKLGLLPLLIVVVGTAGHAAVYATVLPAAVAVVVVSGVLVPRVIRGERAADPVLRQAEDVEAQVWMRTHRRAFTLFVARDGVASALNLGLYLALPFVVTATSGPVDGAVFALCLQISAGLDLVTAGVGVSLTTNVADDPAGGPQTAVRVWRRVVVLVSAAAGVLVLASPVVLLVLGPTYLHHDGIATIVVLAVGSVLRTTFEVWTALLRAQRRTTLLLQCNVVGAALLLGLVITLGHAYGALGAACGVTLATCAFSAVGALGLRHGTTRPSAVPA